MDIAYIIPTYYRPAVLHATLRALEGLGPHAAEIIIINNAPTNRLEVPRRLESGVAITLVTAPNNLGAAARTIGARLANAPWLIMLDDDSAPTTLDFLHVLRQTPPGVGAVGADIYLPCGSREQGGLPEVFVGCGAAVRRRAYLAAGGYDVTFGYYAEEYDLCAKLIHAGYRICHHPAFKVLHHKSNLGRDMNTVVSRLVRNNGWVMQRYAPGNLRRGMVHDNVVRYRALANRIGALKGYQAGLFELASTRWAQCRDLQLSSDSWERFIGLSAARHALEEAADAAPFRTAQIVHRGKNDWAVEAALHEMGCKVLSVQEAASGERADVRVIGTLSPGPAQDALATELANNRPGTRTLTCFPGVYSSVRA